MNAQDIASRLEKIKIGHEDDLDLFFKIFTDEFVSSPEKFNDNDCELIINSWFAQIKTELSPKVFSYDIFAKIFKNINLSLTKLEKTYPEHTQYINKITDDILGLSFSIENLINKENSRHKIRMSFAQILTFTVSRIASNISKIDVRRGLPIYLKSAQHSSIKNDIELNAMGTKKTVGVEDWFLSTAHEAPGFFSVISTNSLQIADHLLTFSSAKLPPSEIIEYLEFLNVSDENILKCLNARLTPERRAKNFNNSPLKEHFLFMEQSAVALEKKILSKGLLSVSPPSLDKEIADKLVHKV